MRSGEYNPIHYHPGCNITTVFFFDDVDEEFIDDIIAPIQTNSFAYGKDVHKKGTTDDGLIEIVYGSSRIMESSTWRIRPNKGEFLIFPAYLLHVVYPFISKQRRITASINYKIHSKRIKNKYSNAVNRSFIAFCYFYFLMKLGVVGSMIKRAKTL